MTYFLDLCTVALTPAPVPVQTEKSKAEGRLAALRLGGIDVDDWLNSALADPKYNGEGEGEGDDREGGDQVGGVFQEEEGADGSPSPPPAGLQAGLRPGALAKVCFVK